MQLLDAFNPLAPGTIDVFAFNFTSLVGTASIVTTSWTCSLRPLQTITDPNPQSHVLGVFVETQIETDGQNMGQPGVGPVLANGAFSVASIGGFMPAHAGGIYSLAATVTTSDGRTLALCANLPIAAC